MKIITWKMENGQTLVEWALVLPVLLLMILGVMDLGRAVYYNSVVYNAAREGARYGIIHPCSENDIKSAVMQKAVATNISDSDININYVPIEYKCTDFPKETPDKISVEVSSNFIPVTPFVGAVTLSGTSTMRVEW
jgi:Flp pilus assembly protein TadG